MHNSLFFFSSLKYVYGQASLKEELKKNKPSGVTDAQIDVLLSNF